MYQLLNERFYQAINYRTQDKNIKVIVNRLFSSMKNSFISSILFVWKETARTNATCLQVNFRFKKIEEIIYIYG